MRTKPPWTDDNYQHAQCPTLRIGFADSWWIIRANGGHIIASTQDPGELQRLIRLESEQGFGAVELLVQGRHPCGCHGMKAASLPSSPTPLALSLEDLGL